MSRGASVELNPGIIVPGRPSISTLRTNEVVNFGPRSAGPTPPRPACP
jgi:hypothetical protein